MFSFYRCSCSLWSIAAISVNRYISICHRLLYPSIYNRHTIPFIIAAIWIICFFIDLPNLIGWGRHSYDPRLMQCTYDFTYKYSYTVFFIGFGFGVPLSVSIFSYIKIIKYAQESSNTLRKIANTGGASIPARRLRKTDKKLIKSVLIILVMFVIMWLPHAIIVLGDYNAQWPRVFHVIGAALAHANSSTNSFIYAASNKTFRKGYVFFLRSVGLSLIKKIGCKQKERPNTGIPPSSPSCIKGLNIAETFI